ncbi:Calcium-activated chloride channel regulator 4 [Myotis davidii]|uniref:Calcium-activated chloride channel regulator 4 n=1 Tax=Myotis davidii TaxID=225400 RepID=L5LYD5_MYODS|nr:Calcium-activated chloride channel regulator 4 [Myotis davidii]
MVLFRSFVFLLVLYLLQGSDTSFVRLNNNGYEGIIIAINPGVPENEALIEKIKNSEEKGEYIHFTPDVVLGKKQNEYGPPDRLLVHEWAHLRWGVFDEYNDDEPFYSASSKRIEATRHDHLYFLQLLQAITSLVVKFCNKQNHNEEAPSLQNKKCEFRSTWEVISNSEDFRNTTPMVESPPSPVFSLLRIRDRIVCLVLDKSGSMGGYNRLNRMNQAAKYFLLQVVENGTWVGMVHFDSTANIKRGKHLFVSDEVQNNGLIDAFGTLASGNADISQKSIEIESKGLTLNDNHWMNGTVIIDSTVGKDTFFLITWVKQQPIISLLDPNGTPMNIFTVDATSQMAYFSIPGTAKVGVWTYSLQAKANSETLTITVNSRAANSSVAPITVNAKMNKDTNSFPSPMIVYAEILQGNIPILGANVTAFIESSSGKTEVLELFDNGAGADTFKDDGVYSRYFTAYSENGRYSLKVRAHGGANTATQNLRHPPNRAVYIPGWVVDVKQYIIRTSGSILDLRDKFDDALQVNTTDLLPNEANSKETFTFKPGNISEENATHIFIAIRSVDNSNLRSKVSNIAQAALFIPQGDPDEIHPNPNPGISISSLVLAPGGSPADSRAGPRADKGGGRLWLQSGEGSGLKLGFLGARQVVALPYPSQLPL